MCHINAEDGDFDKDVTENQVEFSKIKVKVIAPGEEFDASMNPRPTLGELRRAHGAVKAQNVLDVCGSAVRQDS